MNESRSLGALASLAGIAEGYRDIWGHYHPTFDAVRHAILIDMGIACGNASAIETACREQESRQWRHLLPPVQVVRQSQLPPRLTLRLESSRVQEEFIWELVEENGTRHTGALRPVDLPEVGHYRLGSKYFTGYELIIEVRPTCGYHQLSVRRRKQALAACSLIVAPDRCYTPLALTKGGRVFGPALQLYAVRSGRNWGIGDFTDLKRMLEVWVEAGGDIVGCNPLNALFPHNPLHKSPYSPSSRLFLNALYLDVEAIADYSESETVRAKVQSTEFQARLQRLRATEFVDYEAVAAAKLAILEMLYRHFRERHLANDTERARAFRAFEDTEGAPLRLHAAFEALQEHFHARDPTVWGWPVWPEAYRDPEGPAVKAFERSHRERVQFFRYLQWLAGQQLAAVGERSLELGLGIGLYLDLPVSVDPAGAESWAHQSLYALSARIGAPPDDHNPRGQDWGLLPFNPRALQAAAYAPFVAVLRHTMRQAGALRIDHVMGLMRLYWVHREGETTSGAYVHYSFEDTLGILALESQRNQCLVIGEDLGTVPEEVGIALRELGVLSYRLLYFEKDERGELKPPERYPSQALVAISTHDLPTLSGYWQGNDLSVRTELGLFPSEAIKQDRIVARAQDRARLLVGLERAGLLPESVTVDPASCPTMTGELSRAFHAFLARGPSQVMMVQLEDVLGQVEQVNLPSTTDDYPNWSRKLSVAVEHLASDPRFAALAGLLRDARGPQAKAARTLTPTKPLPGRTAVPRATYRFQFNRAFTFADATALVPYLSELGVSHCYASPLLQARPGSLHGYDTIAHDQLNPEIGPREDFERLCATLEDRGMGLILDLVPNHMGVMGSENQWWLDVLENGPASRYARFFDIDWEPLKPDLRGKVLLPILGDRYGSVLTRGELKLQFDAASGAFYVTYFEHRLPIGPRDYPRLLQQRMSVIEMKLGPEAPALQELQSLSTALAHLPPRDAVHPEAIAERHRDKEILKHRLSRLCVEEPEIAQALSDTVAEYDGKPGVAESFAPLHGLLEGQAYRLADWHVASDEINYRRFFDINDLAALRVEEPEVFDLTHQFVLDLAAAGHISGFRIDHPDGLYDPARYYERLRCRAREALATAGQGSDTPTTDIYLTVEKILAVHERLPDDWQVDGTTGYDFLNLVNGLYIDPAAEQPLTRLYHAFVRARPDFDALLYQCRRLVMRHFLASELNVLAHQLDRIADTDWYTRDFTLQQLHDALAEVVACLPVYRTYVSDRRVTAEDRRYVEWAVARAKKKSGAGETSIFDFIQDVLLRHAFADKSPEMQAMVTRFAMQCAQFTAPVMAKAMEDTAFYRYYRLVSLNEVGGDPRRFCVSVPAFHAANLERATRWPHAMLASSTHDNKRSEDVRARINVISELAPEWRAQVRRWARLNRSKGSRLDTLAIPSRNTEYMIYQTLLGVWPLAIPDDDAYRDFCARIEQYVIKAAREAKEETRWTNPNADYEERLVRFVRAILERSETNLFLPPFIEFQEKVARLGLFNSLSQTLLKLTAPGVPDIYQGNADWDFSLVDPDNRRPVDFALRQHLLEEIKKFGIDSGAERVHHTRSLVESMEDGRIKLFLISRTLNLRREYPEVFDKGDYLPLGASGSKAEHLCSFARRYADRSVIVVCPRLFAGLLGEGDALPLGAVWGDTAIELQETLACGRYRNVFTGESVTVEGTGLAIKAVLGHFPVALLESYPAH